MSGDSPYRAPERPAQLVTDDRVGAEIDAGIEAEQRRRLRAERRRRRIERATRIATYGALPFGAAVATILHALDQQGAAGLCIFAMLAAIAGVALVHFIGTIPPRL